MPQTSHKELAAAMQSAGVDAKTIQRVIAALSGNGEKKPGMPPHLKGDGDEGVTKADPFASFVAEQEGWIADGQLAKANNLIPFRSLDDDAPSRTVHDVLTGPEVNLLEVAKSLELADVETDDIREVLTRLAKNAFDGGAVVRGIEAVIETYELDPTSFPHGPKRTTPQAGQARAGMGKTYAWPRDMALAMTDARFDPNYSGADSLTFGSDDSGPEAA